MSKLTKQQKRRVEFLGRIADWFPSKSSRQALKQAEAKNRQIDKKKGYTSSRGRASLTEAKK